MTNDDAETVRKIERDRKRREDELALALLLLLFGTTQVRQLFPNVPLDVWRRATRRANRRGLEDDLIVALRHGFDVRRVLAGWLGDPAVEIIGASMADSHADAFMRFGRQYEVGVSRTDAGPRDEMIDRYRPQARDMAQAMAVNLYHAIVEQSRATPPADVTPAVARAWDSPTAVIRRAFEQCGYAKANPYNLANGIERQIVLASNVGMFVVAGRSGTTLALQHASVMDAKTTVICIKRNGLTLPIDDPYWLANIPPLHAHCRSVIIPARPGRPLSEFYPSVSPDIGYGVMPQGFIDELLRAA